MRRLEIASGTKYGELTTVRESELPGKRKFLCKCSCGAKVEVRLDHLRSGHTRSCGRCGIEYAGERKTLKEWAEEAGLNESTLRARLQVMGMREALEREVR